MILCTLYLCVFWIFFFNDTATTEIYTYGHTLSLHDALPIYAVDQIRSDLPEGILEPQVSRVDIDGGPIAYFSAEATDMTLEELSWYVDNTVAKRLLAVPGMAAVKRGGGVSREIRVILDPTKLQSHGITDRKSTRLNYSH